MNKLEFWVFDEGCYKYKPKNDSSAKLCAIINGGTMEGEYSFIDDYLMDKIEWFAESAGIEIDYTQTTGSIYSRTCQQLFC